MNVRSHKNFMIALGAIALALGALGLAVAFYTGFLPYRLSRGEHGIWIVLTKASFFSLITSLVLGAFTLAVAKRHTIAASRYKSDIGYKRIVQLASFAIAASLAGMVVWLFFDNIHSTTPAFPNDEIRHE